MSDLTISVKPNNTGEQVISIGGRLAIDTAAELKETLHRQLVETPGILIDTEDLGEIDLTGMQLICSACWSANSSGKTFRFKNLHPECITKAIQTLGLQTHKACTHNPDLSCTWCGGTN